MRSVAQKRSLERALLSYTEHLDLALPYLEGRGIAEGTARSEGLGVVVKPIPGHEHLRNRLAIPYLTESGPVNMNFRCMEKHSCKEAGHQKYMSFSGLSPNLYHVRSLQAAGEWIVVTEGEIDAITLNMSGIPAVGVPGAKKWEPFWNLIFDDFVRVYVFEDGDKAGKEFGDKMVSEVSAIRVTMPSGEDVNSMYIKQGAEYLRERIVT